MFKKIFIVFLFSTFIFTGGCALEKEGERLNNNSSEAANTNSTFDFIGEKGEKVFAEGDKILLDSAPFNENNVARFYNTEVDNKIVYFFVVKDKNGVYRAAGNACQVCYSSKIGFRHEGDYMVCNTCGNKYPLAKIATEKGGCNPGPINPNLSLENDKIVIDMSDIKQVVRFF